MNLNQRELTPVYVIFSGMNLNQRELTPVYVTFSGMNLNQRELTQHVEYEPDTYYAAFSAELEICASPLWSMLVHCKTQVGYPLKALPMLRLLTSKAQGCKDFSKTI